MKFSTWFTIPSVCAALILAPASGVLAGTHAKHHKAKKPVAAAHKSSATAPVAASMTAAKPETKSAAKPDTKVAKAGAKKHVAPMSAATGTKKATPATAKTAVKHKAGKHSATKKKSTPAPKMVDAPKSDDVKSTDASMTLPAAK